MCHSDCLICAIQVVSSAAAAKPLLQLLVMVAGHSVAAAEHLYNTPGLIQVTSPPDTRHPKPDTRTPRPETRDPKPEPSGYEPRGGEPSPLQVVLTKFLETTARDPAAKEDVVGHDIRLALHPTPYTSHPTPYTIHQTPYTLHPIPHTLNPKP